MSEIGTTQVVVYPLKDLLFDIEIELWDFVFGEVDGIVYAERVQAICNESITNGIHNIALHLICHTLYRYICHGVPRK